MSGLLSSGDTCGPSNPLQSLSSKINQRQNNGGILPTFHNTQQEQFNTSNRFNKIDNHLEQEFNQFNNSNALYHQHNHSVPNIIHQQQQQQQQQQPQQQQWANDFAKLSLNNPQPVQAIPHKWNQEFVHHHHHQHQHSAYSPYLTNSGITSTNLLSVQAPRFISEHEEIHKADALLTKQDEKFDKIFDQIESDLLNPIQQQEVKLETPISTFDHEKFALTAKLVAELMSKKTNTTATTTRTKFENSNFLKLMNQVSNKSVIINEQGDGFIENN